jgi:HAD superfamily hydrolase (TIGR01484 family)
MKRLIAFDLDGTLAESKQPIGTDMATLLARLLDLVDVAVISGGDWPQFQKQVVSRLPDGANLRRLFIMPTTGTKLYRFDGIWRPVYDESFATDERDRIIAALDEVSAEAGLGHEQAWGPRIEDRGSQVTLSALGQDAPIEAKKAWDPDLAKRKRLQGMLRALLPSLSVNIGGSTSIDITHQGIDKAYGMRKLAEYAGIAFDDILFLGDAIYPGGNDDPVRAAGIDSIPVRDVAETRTAVSAIIACLKP